MPIHITRFNHPTDQGEIVTYAVLQRVPQKSLGDPSIWLIFDSFAVDFQIEGERRIRQIENLIAEVREWNPVKRIEVNVERDKFIETLSERLTDDYLKLRQANEDLQTAIDVSRGAITELATVYVLSHWINEGEIRWSTKIHGEEIDVLVLSNEYIRVIECKANIESTNTDDLVDQLARKVDAVDSQDRKVKAEIWVWENPSEQRESTLTNFGIEVTCLKDKEEITKASTGDIYEVFSRYYPEEDYDDPFSPPKRIDW